MENEASSSVSEADEKWVNELVQQLVAGMNDDKFADVVSLCRESLARVRALHPDDGVLAFVLHQMGHALCVLGQKQNRCDKEGFELLEEATSIFLDMEMKSQAGACIGVMAGLEKEFSIIFFCLFSLSLLDTAQACGQSLRAAEYCLRCHPLVSDEKQDFLLFTWWDCLGAMSVPEQITHLEHLLRLYYPKDAKKRDWSTPEGLIRMALAERLYGVHQFESAKAMLLLALADTDPRLRDMLKRSKITVALCAESAKTGVYGEKVKTDKAVITSYRMCQACRKVDEVGKKGEKNYISFELKKKGEKKESFALHWLPKGLVLQFFGAETGLEKSFVELQKMNVYHC